MRMAFADRMWHGDVTMAGLLGGDVPRHVTHQVADGVAVVTGFVNVIAFHTDDGLLLYDTGTAHTVSTTRRAIRRRCPDRVRYAVYSHGRIDHVGGVAEFDHEAAANEWERPVVIAHEAVLRRFARYPLTTDTARGGGCRAPAPVDGDCRGRRSPR